MRLCACFRLRVFLRYLLPLKPNRRLYLTSNFEVYDWARRVFYGNGDGVSRGHYAYNIGDFLATLRRDRA
jgi:hypothetical protein